MEVSKKKKRIVLQILFLILAILLLAGLFRFISFGEVIILLKQIKFVYILLFILIYVGMVFLSAWRLKIVLSTKNKKVSVFKLVSYNLAGMGLGYILPGMRITGDPMRALLLKRDKISFKIGFSSVFVDRMMDLTVSVFIFSFFAVASILFLALSKKIEWLIGGITFIFLCGALYFYYLILTKKDILIKIIKKLRLTKIKVIKKYEKWIYEFEKEIVSFYKIHKKEFIIANILSVLNTLLLFVGYRLAIFMITRTDVGFIKVFPIMITSGLATWIPTPLGLGSGEVLGAGIFTLLGLGATSGISVSLIYRGIDLLISIVGITFLTIYGINFKKLILE